MVIAFHLVEMAVIPIFLPYEIPLESGHSNIFISLPQPSQTHHSCPLLILWLINTCSKKKKKSNGRQSPHFTFLLKTFDVLLCHFLIEIVDWSPHLWSLLSYFSAKFNFQPTQWNSTKWDNSFLCESLWMNSVQRALWGEQPEQGKCFGHPRTGRQPKRHSHLMTD
jgi:hypothetical protein